MAKTERVRKPEKGEYYINDGRKKSMAKAR